MDIIQSELQEFTVTLIRDNDQQLIHRGMSRVWYMLEFTIKARVLGLQTRKIRKCVFDDSLTFKMIQKEIEDGNFDDINDTLDIPAIGRVVTSQLPKTCLVNIGNIAHRVNEIESFAFAGESPQRVALEDVHKFMSEHQEIEECPED